MSVRVRIQEDISLRYKRFHLAKLYERDGGMTMVILAAEDAALLSAAAESLANDPCLSGVAAGLRGGVVGALADARRDPPEVVSIPGRWARGSCGVRWSMQAQAYRVVAG